MSGPDNPLTGISGEQVERLIASTDRNATASVKLATATTEYQERARLARSRFRWTIVAFCLVLTALLVGVVVLFLKISDSLNASKDARATILDCVQPSGKCAQRSNGQLAQVIAGLERNQVVSAVCAARYVGLPVDVAIAKTERCVRTHHGAIISPPGGQGNNYTPPAGPSSAPSAVGASPPASPSPSPSGQTGGSPPNGHKQPGPPPSSSSGGLCIPVNLAPVSSLLPFPLPTLPILC